MDEKEIKVTGTRVFDSGAHRDPNENKGRYDLLSPLFLKRLAVHTQKGGVARGDRNWEAGMPMDAVLDSAIRHLFNYLEGDRSEDHLAAAAWNVMNLIHTEEQIERGNLPKSLADGLPDYTRKTMTTEEAMKKLLTYGEAMLQPVAYDEIYNDLYNTNRPHEHYDDPKPLLGSHTHTFPDQDCDGKSCSTCVHASPVNGPVPLSERCDSCRRLSNWSMDINETVRC